MSNLVGAREPIYSVRPEVLARAMRRMETEAACRPEKTESPGGLFRLEARIPTELVVNAVAGHGESLQDEGYWKDQVRRNPACAVKYRGKLFFVGGDGARGEGRGARGVLTRFGRAKRFHY